MKKTILVLVESGENRPDFPPAFRHVWHLQPWLGMVSRQDEALPVPDARRTSFLLRQPLVPRTIASFCFVERVRRTLALIEFIFEIDDFSSLWLNVVALSALGVFVAMALMPTFQGLIDGAL